MNNLKDKATREWLINNTGDRLFQIGSVTFDKRSSDNIRHDELFTWMADFAATKVRERELEIARELRDVRNRPNVYFALDDYIEKLEK